MESSFKITLIKKEFYRREIWSFFLSKISRENLIYDFLFNQFKKETSTSWTFDEGYLLSFPILCNGPTDGV